MLPRFVGRVSEDRKQYGGNDIGCEQPSANRSSIIGIPHHVTQRASVDTATSRN
jgi:hypothetical protein